MDQFRGIFRLTYDGDAHIVLRTKVQVRFFILACMPYVAQITREIGQPPEPQATGYSPHGWYKGYVGC